MVEELILASGLARGCVEGEGRGMDVALVDFVIEDGRGFRDQKAEEVVAEDCGLEFEELVLCCLSRLRHGQA